jgi:type I restriction enzyme M protein
VKADGWSLDDKRTPLLAEEKLGLAPGIELSPEEQPKNNLPVAARWLLRVTTERDRPRTAQSFCVPKAEIAENGYDLSLNRYKEVIHEEVVHIPPKQILAELVLASTVTACMSNRCRHFSSACIGCITEE